MGVLPERDWILRAPTLQRKLALTAKIQDEVGHAQLLYRVVEDLGKPRDACLDDLIAGKSKFHNVFHYPTRTWGDVGVIAWLVDAAAIISQKALLKCSYAPKHGSCGRLLGGVVPHPPRAGRDLTLVNGNGRAARARAGSSRTGGGSADDVPRQPHPRRRRPMVRWRIRARRTRSAPAVPRGLRAAGLGARADPAGPRSSGSGRRSLGYTEPDWDRLMARGLTCTASAAERLAFRRLSRAEVDWVSRGGLLADAA